MKLVCGTAEWLGKYQECCEHRQMGYRPWVGGRSILVAQGQELVAGLMVYETSGPFLLFEHLVTNQTAGLRDRWAAVDLIARELVTACRHSGKLPLVTVRHKGIARILKRHGLTETGAVLYSCAISDLETNDN